MPRVAAQVLPFEPGQQPVEAGTRPARDAGAEQLAGKPGRDETAADVHPVGTPERLDQPRMGAAVGARSWNAAVMPIFSTVSASVGDRDAHRFATRYAWFR